ncbi:MAG: hypothetical protein HKN33_17825, partial [Pyrinomonadaceae bacterium]|nr:hypothetical protein [Pyrinomonadaceae bacterium]
TVVREHHRPFVAFNERIKKLVRVERAVFVGGIEEDTIYRVESYKTAEPEKLGESFRKFRWSSDANAFPVNLGCYSGYRLVSSSKKHYFESLQIFTPKALVVITFLNRKGKTSATKIFLDSVRMKPAARECELNANADRKAGYLSPFERSKRIVKSSGKTKIRLEMATKPRPGYTMMARNNNVAGTIGVKAIFDRNGIAYVDEVTKSLPDGLVNQAEIAVLQTLFFPEVRRGTRRGLVKRIIYNFSIY